jgi:ribonuclease HI
MKQLKFQHSHAQAIMAGSKTTTLRVADDKDLRSGDAVEVIDKVDNDDPQTWVASGVMTVSGVSEYYLEAIPQSVLEKTELKHADKEELLTFLRRFYGNHIQETSIVKVVHFSFQPYVQPRLFLEQTISSDAVPEEVKLYADGGSRGNPGPSASGYVIKTMDDQVIHQYNHYLGITTNNQAEYHALIAGLKWCSENHVKRLHVFLDSLLAINQMKGTYKVKNRDLWSLYEGAKELSVKFEKVTFTHVPRELNKLADAEVNKALDAVKGADAVQ